MSYSPLLCVSFSSCEMSSLVFFFSPPRLDLVPFVSVLLSPCSPFLDSSPGHWTPHLFESYFNSLLSFLLVSVFSLSNFSLFFA